MFPDEHCLLMAVPYRRYRQGIDDYLIAKLGKRIFVTGKPVFESIQRRESAYFIGTNAVQKRVIRRLRMVLVTV